MKLKKFLCLIATGIIIGTSLTSVAKADKPGDPITVEIENKILNFNVLDDKGVRYSVYFNPNTGIFSAETTN